ncbi:MAG TPA: hypothetical protein VGI74_10350 [Streptosporangiaceae bacterium]
MARSASSRRPRPRSLFAISLAAATLAAAQLLATPATGLATARAHPAAARAGASGELDCNGHSPIQRPIKPGGTICAEVHGGGKDGHLADNGFYIGHDEPTLQFYSTQPGSSTKATWVQTLPRDPAKPPTENGPLKDVTHFFELMPALWFSMDLCDPQSYPLLPCKPDSDTNSPHGKYPGGGSAFLELQFYPPGFPPFTDGLSCDGTHWCAALTIDSLECTANFTTCNNRCIEPVNSAFIQTNGVPTGPPGPQRADLNTFTPNQSTLLMNPGDKLQIRIFDSKTAGALETQIRDLTSGRSGFMQASAKNGFMNTSIANCSGSPWSFRPLYSTASRVNQGGWALANINVAYEIGHFIPCSGLRQFAPVHVGSFSDPAWDLCRGAYQNAGPTTGEVNNGICFKAGDTHGELNSAPDLATGCTGGDLDYHGTSYWRDWPDSVTPGTFPSELTMQQPTTVNGAHYPQMQFLTDNPATNFRCNAQKLANCVVPPLQAPGHFYPYWTQATVHGACVWEFGQMPNGNTFGGDKQYGKPTVLSHIINLGIMDESKVMPNPDC